MGNTQITAIYEPFIGTKAAAEMLDVSTKTVERLAQRGEIPAAKVGDLWKFRASLLHEWMSKQLQSSHSPRPVSRKASTR